MLGFFKSSRTSTENRQQIQKKVDDVDVKQKSCNYVIVVAHFGHDKSGVKNYVDRSEHNHNTLYNHVNEETPEHKTENNNGYGHEK